MFSPLEKVLLAVVFPLLLAGVIKGTYAVSKLQTKLENPREIATYTIQPGDNLSKLYARFARKQIPLKAPWISQLMEYNPQVENVHHLQAGMSIQIPLY
jgi:cell division protein YceG involved in septum cleavage